MKYMYVLNASGASIAPCIILMKKNQSSKQSLEVTDKSEVFLAYNHLYHGSRRKKTFLLLICASKFKIGNSATLNCWTWN